VGSGTSEEVVELAAMEGVPAPVDDLEDSADANGDEDGDATKDDEPEVALVPEPTVMVVVPADCVNKTVDMF
jgi:hypothetical protein